jgi:hypothetical protein
VTDGRYRYTQPDLDQWAHRGGIDLRQATSARMYDYYLGGCNNFQADREAAEQVVARMPDVPLIARANRSFLRRVVRYLVGQGIRQFLDVGSGIPTVGNVHEVAQRDAPDSRVLYVDLDPVAVRHARHLLAGNPLAGAVEGDLRRPGELLELLGKPPVPEILDLTRPTALLMVSLLHFVPGPEAHPAVARLRAALAPGSYLAVSHGASGGFDAGQAEAVQNVYQSTATPGGLRSGPEIADFFGDFELVDPGLVWVSQWRPEPDPIDEGFGGDPRRSGILAGVGRKPA